MKLSLEQREQFNEQGYLHAKQLLKVESYDSVLETLLVLLNKYAPGKFSEFRVNDLMENQKFHDRLIELRQETPKLFGSVYDCLQVSVGLLTFCNQQELVEASAFLLDDAPNALMSHSQVLRMDPPQDKRNLLDWHYDFFINDPGHPNMGGMGTWMPLQQITKESGGLELLIGSHRTTFEQVTAPSKRGDETTSEAFDMPQSYIDAHDKFYPEPTIGDVIFFPMKLAHRGVSNVSNRIRFTCLSRFYRFKSEDFLPGRKDYQLISK